MRLGCVLRVLSICIVIQFDPIVYADTDKIDLEIIAEAIHRQRLCRNGLWTKSLCIGRLRDGSEDRRQMITWLVDGEGRERLRVDLLGSKDDLNHVEWTQEAAFDGNYCSTWDSQNQGSGLVGTFKVPFLTDLTPPRQFLTVCGGGTEFASEVDEYIASFRDHLLEFKRTNDLIEIVGKDCGSDDDSIRFRLDPSKGFQMVYLEMFDSKGLLTIYEIHELSRFRGSKGEFWFPAHATWQGYDLVSRQPDYTVEYRLVELKADQNFGIEDFRLTYAPGTLIHNLDTSEGVYITAETAPEDIPFFANKSTTLQEFDRRQFTPPSESSGSSRLRYWILIFTAALLVLASFLGLRKAVPKVSE